MSEYDNELSKMVAELNRAAPSQKQAVVRGMQSTASLDQLLHAAAGRGASDVLLIAGAPAMLRVTGNLTPVNLLRVNLLRVCYIIRSGCGSGCL